MLSVILYAVGFIKTLIFLGIVYLIVRMYRGIVNQQPQQNQKTSAQNQKRKDGETTIRYNQNGKKVVDKNDGEYVDFEEVDK